MNKTSFYTSIRASLFQGKISARQFEGTETIIAAFKSNCITDNRWLAYGLATCYHETAKTMQPIEEFGKGKGHKYGMPLKQNGKPYTEPDQLYYGRGYVQLTWFENYDNMGKILGLPLLEQPELALMPIIASKIMVEGMTKGISGTGDFTGVSLETYFNDSQTDWVNARRIINGLDKAELIANYATAFYQAIILT